MLKLITSNRNRCYNFRVRRLPESYKDVPDAICTFIKDLIPDILHHSMELDRAHKALRTPRADGLPRDIVVKPHLYTFKEEMMRKSRAMSKLSFQGHELHIFADLSPSIIQKRSPQTTVQHLNRKINQILVVSIPNQAHIQGQALYFCLPAGGRKTPTETRSYQPRPNSSTYCTRFHLVEKAVSH